MNLKDIHVSYEQAKNDYNNRIDRLSDLALEELKKRIVELFESTPENSITSLYWVQYIPSFNDGDVCEFTVCDLNWECDEVDVSYDNPIIEEISDFLQDNDDILEAMFGANVKITIHREDPTDFVITDYYD